MSKKKEQLNTLSIIKKLKQGNTDFVANKPRQMIDKSKMSAEQEPSAVILGCSDSRVPPELIFNQGFGDLFVIRIAGNIVSLPVLESIEFAITQFDVPLIIVLGHTQCGAVKICMDCANSNVEENTEGLKSIISNINPVINKISDSNPNSEKIEMLVENANVIQSMQQLMESDVLKDRVNNQQLQIVGAKFEIETGEVHFFD